MTIDNLKNEFVKIFNKSAEFVYFCPGRVNLIGEHIDYNGGMVMPCAITLGTTLLVAKNNDQVFRFRAIDFPETTDQPKQDSYIKSGQEWYNYPIGVIQEFTKAGIEITGLDFLFSGNLPIGSGLSSSASIEVLTAHALNEIFGGSFSKIDLALLGKRVENDFMGLNSGIMDQFAVAMGNNNQAILLNCDTLDYEYLPFEIGEYILAIINTNKPRKLVESKYNERFNECRTALKVLQSKLNISHLCEVSVQEFEEHKALINDPIVEKRTLHVITEDERVKEAKQALVTGNIKRFGELMYASHESLKNDYEVSGNELDAIVSFAKNYPGCIGARMTGAGFGGCAIALVHKDQFDDFSDKLIANYEATIGYKPGVFSSVIADGVRTIS
ncbi:MAG TPA: galactokinase [Niabella sp.]|nr:galactokinase [Niabella sp.]HQW14998.1 galactokinase [Niabella sp.]HQX20110.1 galactokinase [Niabella sp.]HQX40378.1 galactokinase [Niabella sp.]HRB06715.1 galactokinase [Niabella sp.]